MTNTQSQQKESLLRILAIAGLVGIILLIVFLSVQIVKVAPSAFSSLASLAQGISQYDESNEMNDVPLTPEASKSELAVGEKTTITIGSPEAIGTYTFSYDCAANANLMAHNDDGGRELRCGTVYNLSSNDIELELTSGATGTAEIVYQVGFLRPTDELPYRNGSGTLLAVVEAMEEPAGEVAGESTSEEVADSEETEEEVVTPAPEPVTTTQYVYQIPSSNPNGTVDLAVQYVGVGDENGLTGTLEQNSSGVFFFEVKNIGTKTSNTWGFTVDLPGGGEYRSDIQAPLRPNERATLALTVNTDEGSSHNFVVEVTTSEDRTAVNNRFSQRVALR